MSPFFICDHSYWCPKTIGTEYTTVPEAWQTVKDPFIVGFGKLSQTNPLFVNVLLLEKVINKLSACNCDCSILKINLEWIRIACFVSFDNLDLHN